MKHSMLMTVLVLFCLSSRFAFSVNENENDVQPEIVFEQPGDLVADCCFVSAASLEVPCQNQTTENGFLVSSNLNGLCWNYPDQERQSLALNDIDNKNLDQINETIFEPLPIEVDLVRLE